MNWVRKWLGWPGALIFGGGLMGAGQANSIHDLGQAFAIGACVGAGMSLFLVYVQWLTGGKQ